MVHEILGRPFLLEAHPGSAVRLTHEDWPIVGEGATLLQAEQHLLAAARELAATYLKQDLAAQALPLRDFLFDTLP